MASFFRRNRRRALRGATGDPFVHLYNMGAANRLVLSNADGRCYHLDGRAVRDGDQLDLQMDAYVDGQLKKVWRPGRYEWTPEGHDPPRLYLYGCDAIFIRLTPLSVLRWSTAPPTVANSRSRKPPTSPQSDAN